MSRMNGTDLAKLVCVVPLKLLFSPLTFLAFLFLKPGYGLEPRGDNITVLVIPKYLAFCLGFFVLTQLFLSGVTQLAILSGGTRPAPWGMQLGQWHWTNAVAWVLTLFVLNLYRTGMEGNIMGFFGFPILLLALACQTFASWDWLSGSLWQCVVQFSRPGIEGYLSLSWGRQAAAILLLSPITLYLFRSLLISNESKAGYAGNLALSLLSAVITSALLAIGWVVLLWLARWLTLGKEGFLPFALSYLAQIHPSTVLAAALTAVGYLLVLWESLTESAQDPGNSGWVPTQVLLAFLILLASGAQTVVRLWRP